jgi:hypothetical protein
MLRELLTEALASDLQLELAGHARGLVELKRMIAGKDIDVVILGLPDDDLSPAHYELFDADPRIRILALADHGRRVSLCELRPHRALLGEGAPRDLMRTLRAEVRAGARWSDRATLGSG